MKSFQDFEEMRAEELMSAVYARLEAVRSAFGAQYPSADFMLALVNVAFEAERMLGAPVSEHDGTIVVDCRSDAELLDAAISRFQEAKAGASVPMCAAIEALRTFYYRLRRNGPVVGPASRGRSGSAPDPDEYGDD